ncbi:unnamed protein product [Pedinophyceae sp. YPF-701]|nr:unnamed protein product [Pedinophyceae sp. YPF-701]
MHKPVNRQIKASHVRLVPADGTASRVLPFREAMAVAREAGLDMVQVAQEAGRDGGDPLPVVRLMDVRRVQRERAESRQQKQEARRRMKELQEEAKEARFGVHIEGHDRSIKLRRAMQWLAKGLPVKVSCTFRPRLDSRADAERVLAEAVKELVESGAAEEVQGGRGGGGAAVFAMVRAPGAAKEGASDAKS